MNIIMFAALIFVATLASAQSMFRCTKAGVSSYQDKPCEGMVVPPTAAPVTVANNAPKQTQGTVAPSPNSTSKAMDEAYQQHMARGEFALAKSFATNDTQRNAAAMKLAQLQSQCASMAIRTQQADANNKHMNGRWQHAAESADAQYRLKCGSL